MSLWGTLARKGAYHVLHPLLRPLRRALPLRDSARVLLLCRNEVLLIRNIGVARWSLPGGALHPGEDSEEGALRELKEELDIDGTVEYRLGTYHSHRVGQTQQVHVFVARTDSLYRKKQWEIDEARWFDWSDLPPNLSPATARRIGEYKNGLRSISTFW